MAALREVVVLRSRWYRDRGGHLIAPAIVFATNLRMVEVRNYLTDF